MSDESNFSRRASWSGNSKLGSQGNVTVFGVLQTGQIRVTFVSGISAEGSVTLETLKVFMQFVHS